MTNEPDPTVNWRIVNGEVKEVPLVDVVKSTDTISATSIQHVMRQGIIQTSRPSRSGSPRYISLADAVLLVTAAGMALAAGVALSAMLRALKSSGASIDPENGGVIQLSIPIPIRVDITASKAA